MMTKMNWEPKFGKRVICPRTDPAWFSGAKTKNGGKSGKRRKTKKNSGPRSWEEMIAKIPPKREDNYRRKRWSSR